MPDVRYLLWDFGDTLVDERWMWPCPEGVRQLDRFVSRARRR